MVAHLKHPLARLQRVAGLVKPYPPGHPVPGAGDGAVRLDASQQAQIASMLKVASVVCSITYLRAEGVAEGGEACRPHRHFNKRLSSSVGFRTDAETVTDNYAAGERSCLRPTACKNIS